MEQRYHRMQDEQTWPGLARNQDFAEEGLRPRVKMFSKKFLIGNRGDQTSVTQRYQLP